MKIKQLGYVLMAAMPLSLMFAATASAAPRAPEHLTITIDVSAPPTTPSPAVATGPISGTGTDTQTSDRTPGKIGMNAKTDHATDLLSLPDGTVSIKDQGVNSGSFDQATCTLHVHETGIWTIVGGTGAYADAKGHGHFTLTGTVQATPDPNAPGGCAFGPPTGTLVVDATGTVSV